MRIDNVIANITTIPQRSHSDLQNLSADDHPQYGDLSQNETVSGGWTFGIIPTLPASDPTTANQAARKGYVDTASTVVHTTGDETIGGIKTFSSIPVLPATDPTTANQAARKGYVDGLLGTLVKGISDNFERVDHTGTLTQTTLKSFTIPANSLSTNGWLRIKLFYNAVNQGASQNSILRVKFDASQIYYQVHTNTVNGYYIGYVYGGNRNSLTSQFWAALAVDIENTTISEKFLQHTTSAVNTGADVTVTITGQLDNTGSHIYFEGYTAEIVKA